LVNTVIAGNWVELLKKRDYRVVSLVHEMPNVIKAWGAGDRAKELIHNSDCVIFPSLYVKDKLKELVNCDFQFKILTQGQYLKAEKKHNKLDTNKYIINKFSWEEKPIVLNVATGNLRKGFDLFVKMASIQKDINFVWVGDVDKQLTQWARKEYRFHEMENLKLLGYIGDKELLMQIYSGADVFALTSREEPFGSIVLESMNAGTPVVAFEGAGGFQDVVISKETGFLVEYESESKMLEKINLLLNDKTMYLKLSKKARTAVEKYDFDDYVGCLMDLLRGNSESL
jgi:glycosyltransferase involved in cell wall biosynthesis